VAGVALVVVLEAPGQVLGVVVQQVARAQVLPGLDRRA
jgi:hypothetical protein